jgi:hypothetical protein
MANRIQKMSECTRCGADFSCGMVDGAQKNENGECWCAELPSINPEVLASLRNANAVASCFCPACLREALRIAAKT